MGASLGSGLQSERIVPITGDGKSPSKPSPTLKVAKRSTLQLGRRESLFFESYFASRERRIHSLVYQLLAVFGSGDTVLCPIQRRFLASAKSLFHESVAEGGWLKMPLFAVYLEYVLPQLEVCGRRLHPVQASALQEALLIALVDHLRFTSLDWAQTERLLASVSHGILTRKVVLGEL